MHYAKRTITRQQGIHSFSGSQWSYHPTTTHSFLITRLPTERSPDNKAFINYYPVANGTITRQQGIHSFSGCCSLLMCIPRTQVYQRSVRRLFGAVLHLNGVHLWGYLPRLAPWQRRLQYVPVEWAGWFSPTTAGWRTDGGMGVGWGGGGNCALPCMRCTHCCRHGLVVAGRSRSAAGVLQRDGDAL